MKLKRVGVFSWGLVSCIWYVGLGLIIGTFITVLTLMGTVFSSSNETGLMSLFLGVGAIFYAPLFLSFFGFIGGILTAFIYNLYAKWTGGIEMEFDIEENFTSSTTGK